MDRFKFRVWREEEKRFVESDCGSPLVISLEGCLCDSYDHLDYDGFGIIEQCTGLQDKNGKLIYEGDIVKAPLSYKYEIKWSDGNWGLFFGNGQYDICLCERVSKELEVIGNIHENKSNI